MWLYEGEEIDDAAVDGYVGFVYRITHLPSRKIYIGKKLLRKVRRKRVKGKARRVKTETSSDWRTYYGSNKLLLEDVEIHGHDEFKREILHLCKTKGMTNYLELKEQILHCALEREDSYNQWIMVRVHRSHLK